MENKYIFLIFILIMVFRGIKGLADQQAAQRAAKQNDDGNDPWEDWDLNALPGVKKQEAEPQAEAPENVRPQARIISAIPQDNKDLFKAAGFPFLPMSGTPESVVAAGHDAGRQKGRLRVKGKPAPEPPPIPEPPLTSTTLETAAAPCGFTHEEHKDVVCGFEIKDAPAPDAQAHQRRIVVGVGSRSKLQQGLLLGEILGRPRAFDL